MSSVAPLQIFWGFRMPFLALRVISGVIARVISGVITRVISGVITRASGLASLPHCPDQRKQRLTLSGQALWRGGNRPDLPQARRYSRSTRDLTTWQVRKSGNGLLSRIAWKKPRLSAS